MCYFPIRISASAIVLFIAMPAVAQTGDAPAPGDEVLTELATEFYAKEYSISVDEARRQIAELKRVGRLAQEAGLDGDDSSAGIEVDRSNGGFNVSLRYAGAKGKATQSLEARGVKVKQAKKSKKQHKEDVRQVATALGIKNKDYAIIYDDLANTATLLVKGNKANFPNIPALPDGISVEFRDELITMTANIYGSDSITEGGTVGYAATRSGIRGVTAPGHIHNGQTSFTVNGDLQTISFQAYDAQNDFVWGNKTTSAYGAWIRVTTAGGWKAVGSVGVLHSATPYCKYGRTSGLTCGTYSRTYTGPWQTFASGTFPLIKGTVQMAQQGDSGGPVFEDLGTKAAAIGTVIGYTGTGNKELVVYPAERITAKGVTIMTQ